MTLNTITAATQIGGGIDLVAGDTSGNVVKAAVS